ncbi:MAG: hypothetical protein ACR2HJ_10370 [Fimbriimonadales bacterium]
MLCYIFVLSPLEHRVSAGGLPAFPRRLCPHYRSSRGQDLTGLKGHGPAALGGGGFTHFLRRAFAYTN